MPLIASPRHTPADHETWQRTVRTAEVHGQLKHHRKQIQRSVDAVMSFTGVGNGYAGVSWGKDSVVIAHMIATLCPRVPLVWVRVEPIANPDCDLVRDEFLRMFPRVKYDELTVWCRRDDDGWHATGTLERGFGIAAQRYGQRYMSGIRAEESGIRKLRVAKHGLVSSNTCAPIGWWGSWDVWAYLLTRGLPVHPAYACSFGGQLAPGRIRVASLGGRRGDGMGRAEWERQYYGRELAALDRPSI
jgi:phosphoadenosine phosphosulfate reductase